MCPSVTQQHAAGERSPRSAVAVSASEKQALPDSLVFLGLSTWLILICALQTGKWVLHTQERVALMKEAWVCLLADDADSPVLLFCQC